MCFTKTGVGHSQYVEECILFLFNQNEVKRENHKREMRIKFQDKQRKSRTKEQTTEKGNGITRYRNNLAQENQNQ